LRATAASNLIIDYCGVGDFTTAQKLYDAVVAFGDTSEITSIRTNMADIYIKSLIKLLRRNLLFT